MGELESVLNCFRYEPFFQLSVLRVLGTGRFVTVVIVELKCGARGSRAVKRFETAVLFFEGDGDIGDAEAWVAQGERWQPQMSALPKLERSSAMSSGVAAFVSRAERGVRVSASPVTHIASFILAESYPSSPCFSFTLSPPSALALPWCLLCARQVSGALAACNPG